MCFDADDVNIASLRARKVNMTSLAVRISLKKLLVLPGLIADVHISTFVRQLHVISTPSM